MSDSDSDDELMNRLKSGAFHRVHAHHEDCAYCAASNATLPCTTCQAAYYCSESCKRRHFAAHRAFCISTREQNEPSDDEEESSEEESEEEDAEDHSLRRSASTSSRRSSARGPAAFATAAPVAPAAGVQIPGLTPKQVKKLLELSAKAEAMTTSKTVEELQQQISELMKHRDQELSEKSKNGQNKALERASSSIVDGKLNEIKELQKKLQELERKTQTIEISTRNSMANGGQRGSTIRATKAQVYMPLLVKDDDAFRKYFKLKDMSMPIEQIRAKMEADGVNPALLDTPDEISPNDPGAPEGAYIPMMVKDDPKFKKYFKLKQMNMPTDQIKMKMEADGVDPELLENPGKVSPNDPGPPLFVDHDPNDVRMSMPGMGFGSALSPTSDALRMSMPSFPAPPYVPLLVKDDEQYKKFFKLKQMGMPAEQIKLKMSAENIDPTLIDRPDDVSPNDPGPPASPTGAAGQGPITMEQLFSILMQHHEVIQRVTPGSNASGGGGGGSDRGSFGAPSGPPPTVEDQMAKELAAAESALDDIFGDEQQQAKGPGGMSMIEQLEKKARKESNKKLVENHDEIVRLIRDVLNKKFESDEHAMKYFAEVSPKLEYYGLALGTDAVQTWSARLLIKNKDTRDWYFSEQDRLDAGKAYGRLWSMSFLERDSGQLIAKRSQILNAPVTLRATVKNKVELIDKFTQLLKDTVKLKHKVFKNASYVAEVRRLAENQIPERFEERGTELTDSTTALSDAALDLAEEEFRILDTTTRAKKIRAHTVIHVAEKAVQLVGIVKKLGAHGINEARLAAVETKAKALREEYLSGAQEEEDEDDVL